MSGRALEDCSWRGDLVPDHRGSGQGGPGMQQAARPRRHPALERVQAPGWGRERPVSHPGMWAAGGAARAGRG